MLFSSAHGRCRPTGPAWAGCFTLCALSLCTANVAAELRTPDITITDPTHDWLARPTAPADSLPFDIQTHRPPDIIEIRFGKWRPDDAQLDLFEGRFLPPGKFFRLDLHLLGLMNPPGSTRPWSFDPFAYGPNPAFGFVEIDMDHDVETGGELDAPQYRYVSNAARFAGKPSSDPLEDRLALDNHAFDDDFETPPFIERSGEEFHLALLGNLFDPANIVVLAGDDDWLFETGEIWRITAPWFHRAHGYEPFSLATGGHVPGAYEPPCTLQFAHDADSDKTTISLVFPLRNEAAAEMWGQPVQPPNSDSSDQFSVHEALLDLHWSAEFIDEFPTGLPEEAIILEWKDKDPGAHLDPDDWRLSALLGTSYTAPPTTTEYFVWSDTLPNCRRGDVNGDGDADPGDRNAIQGYIDLHDADDGLVDGRVVLATHPVAFTVFDVDHSGIVDTLDVALVSTPLDLDDDDDVDLADFAAFQACAQDSATPHGGLPCGLSDIDLDGDVDTEDWRRLTISWTGPSDPDDDGP